VKDELAGKRVRCAVCQSILDVPAAVVPARPPSEALTPGPPPSPPSVLPAQAPGTIPAVLPAQRPGTPLAVAAPSPAPAATPFKAVRVSIIVKRDPAFLVQRKPFVSEISSDGLPLLDARGRTFTLPVGSPVRYLGGNRLEVQVMGQPVELAVSRWAHYQDRFARDLVEFLQGKRPTLNGSSYRLPNWFIPLIGFPLFALALVLPNSQRLGQPGTLLLALVFGALGAAFSWINFLMLQKERFALPLRVGAAIGTNVVIYGLAIGLLVLMNTDRRSEMEQTGPVRFRPPGEGFEAEFFGDPKSSNADQGDLKIRRHKLEVPSERADFVVEVIDTSKADLAATASARRQKITLGKGASEADYQKVLLGLADDLVNQAYPQGFGLKKLPLDDLNGHPVFGYELALPDDVTVRRRAAVVRRKIYFWTVSSDRMVGIRYQANVFHDRFRLIDPPEPWQVVKKEEKKPVKPVGRITLQAPRLAVALAYQRGENRLVCRTPYGEVKLWDLATQRALDDPKAQVPELHKEIYALSPDGRKLAVVAKDKMVKVVSLDGSRPPLTLEPSPAYVVGDQVQMAGRLLFSPNGAYLCIDLARGGNTRPIKIWNLLENKLQGQLDDGKPMFSQDLEFAGDSSKLATVRDGGVQIWNPMGGKLADLKSTVKLKGPLAWAPSGKILAVLGEDNKVHLLSLDDGKELQTISPRGVFWRMAFHPSGSWLAVHEGERTIRFYTVPAGKMVREENVPDGDIRAMLFIEDNDRLGVAAGPWIQVYDLQRFKLEK
jgi:WD40 repeat protein